MEIENTRRLLLMMIICVSCVLHVTNSKEVRTTINAEDYVQYLMSPGFPKGYQNNMTYYYYIRNENLNNTVTVDVLLCILEYADEKVDVCQLDKLTIYDGNRVNDPVFYEGCCLIPPKGPFKSTGPMMMVVLHTDKTISEPGFVLKYYNNKCCRDRPEMTTKKTEGTNKNTTTEESTGRPSYYFMVATVTICVTVLVVTLLVVILCFTKLRRKR